MKLSNQRDFYKTNSPEQMGYYRGINNMTQEDLAEKSGVDLQLIKDIENGEVELGLLDVLTGLDLAQALNVSIDVLCQEIIPEK